MCKGNAKGRGSFGKGGDNNLSVITRKRKRTFFRRFGLVSDFFTKCKILDAYGWKAGPGCNPPRRHTVGRMGLAGDTAMLYSTETAMFANNQPREKHND